MNTRRTGKGWTDLAVRCTSTAISIRAREVNATCPSTPAVARPALRCVTCRTLISVFDQLRSIIFCRFLTKARSCAFDALKILPRSRRTCSSCTGHTIVSQSRGLSSGPFAPRAAIALSKAKAVIASNLPFGSVVPARCRSKAHPPHVSLLSQPGTRPGIRPVIRAASGWRTGLTAPAFPLSFDHRHSLLGRPVPATGCRLPHGRPTTAPRAMDLTGFPRSARMSYDRVGCQLYPGSSGVPTTVEPSSVAARRISTARSLSSPQHDPTWGVAVTRHHHWFTHVHPSGLPLACDTRSERATLGFSLSFAPSRYQPRTSGRGQVQDTDLKSRLRHDQAEPPKRTDLLITCDLVSHRSAADAHDG